MNESPQTDELELFFEADREIPPMPADSMGRILTRLTGVAAAAAVIAPTSALAAVTAKTVVLSGIALFTAGALTGGAAVWTLKPDAPNAVSSPADAVITPPEMPTEAAPILVEEPEQTSTPSVTPPSMAEAPVRVPRASTLAAERRLLESARAALARGRASHATSVLARHRRRFPRGELVEERASLEVEAAFAAEAWDRVESLASRFFREHGDSLYRSRVARLRRQARAQAEGE